jgi:hypothetical protein
MPADLGSAARSFATLVAAVNKTLVHTAAARREEFELRRVPKTQVEKIDPAKLAPALGRGERLARELD